MKKKEKDEKKKVDDFKKFRKYILTLGCKGFIVILKDGSSFSWAEDINGRLLLVNASKIESKIVDRLNQNKANEYYNKHLVYKKDVSNKKKLDYFG